MEKYDLTRMVPQLSITVMGVSIFAMLIIVVLFGIWVKKAYPEGNKGLFMGMASYFLICSCLIRILYMLESQIAGAFTPNGQAEGQLAAIQNSGEMIALILECVILVVCLYFAFAKMFYQPAATCFGNVLMFGFGFALVETLQWIINTAMNWLFCTTLNGIGLKDIVETLEADQVDDYMKSVEPLLTNGPVYYIMLFAERIFFIAFIIALVSLLYLVVKGVVERRYLGILMGIYFMYYIPALLRNFGVISSDVIMFVIFAVYIVAVIIFAKKQLIKYIPDEYEHYKEIKARGIYNVVFASKMQNKKPAKGSISQNANKRTND